jgi:hypothetical protein
LAEGCACSRATTALIQNLNRLAGKFKNRNPVNRASDLLASKSSLPYPYGAGKDQLARNHYPKPDLPCFWHSLLHSPDSKAVYIN